MRRLICGTRIALFSGRVCPLHQLSGFSDEETHFLIERINFVLLFSRPLFQHRNPLAQGS